MCIAETGDVQDGYVVSAVLVVGREGATEMQVTDAQHRFANEHPESAAPEIEAGRRGDIQVAAGPIVPARASTAAGTTGSRHAAATTAASRPRSVRRSVKSASTASAPRYADLLNEYATPASSAAVAASTATRVIPWRALGRQPSRTARATTNKAPSVLWFRAPVCAAATAAPFTAGALPALASEERELKFLAAPRKPRKKQKRPRPAVFPRAARRSRATPAAPRSASAGPAGPGR